MEYVGKHVTAQPIPLNERVEGRVFDPGLGEVLRKALSKNPDDRFQTTIELADALAPYAGHPSTVGAEIPSAPSHRPPPAVEQKPDAADSSRGPSKSMLVIVALGCMILGGLGAVLLMNLLGK